MKRYGNLWGAICERSNLELAADLALKGKKINKEVREFLANRAALLDDLQASLINETYHFSPLRHFIVYEPKKREIYHPPFYPDKIIHHALMNVVKPLIIEKFTTDTYGSIKGRGVTLASERLKKVLKNNPDSYYMQIDCQKYYQSIDHNICKDAIRRVIKCPQTLRLIDSLIDVHDEGLAIGVFPSQYFANLVLARFDHWVKEEMRVPHYFRYMDDIVLVLPDKASAHNALSEIKKQMSDLKLTIKNNSRIAPVECGIDFLGYKFYPTHTLLRKRIKESMQRTVRKLVKKEVSDEVFKRKTAAHFGWCKHANCRNLIRTTFGERITLYDKNMQFKRLSEIREAENWFGLPKDKRVSIKSLFNVDIVFFDNLITTIKGETKVVVKFAYPDRPEDYHYFITRSDVMMDRLERDKEHMPFIATIKQIKNYTAYE